MTNRDGPGPAGAPPVRRAGPAGRPPAASPAFLLMALGRRVRAEVETALRAHELSLRHVSVLGHLAREPGLSYSELGRRADVTPQGMQALLRQLEDRGAVRRSTPVGRGRTAQLHLTDLGQELLAAGQGAVDEADRRLLADLGPHDAQALTGALLHLFVGRVDRDRTTPTEGTAGPAGAADRGA